MTVKELQQQIYKLNTKIKAMSKKHTETNLKFSKSLSEKDDIIIEKNNIIIGLQNDMFVLQDELRELYFLQDFLSRGGENGK